MWCAHDEVILLPGISSCGLHTFEAVLVLLLTGCATTAHSLYIKRRPYSGSFHTRDGQSALAAGIAVAALLLSHVALAVLDASPGREHQNGWHADPSRLFSALAYCLLYAIVAALLLVGYLLSIPVPCVRAASQTLVGIYTLRTAVTVELYNAGEVHGGSLVITSLQLMGLMCYAIVATVRAAGEHAESDATQPLLGAQPVPSKPGGPKQKPEKPWWSALGKSIAFVWPKDGRLQVRALSCVLLILLIRALNLAVPAFYGKMVDTLSDVTAQHKQEPTIVQSFKSVFFPWVFAYLLARFLQGGGGVGSVGIMSNLRSFLWIPISQDAEKRISLRAFSHMLSLDLSFHLERKTGELIRIMDRGTSSIRNLLETMLFSIGPALIDVLGAAAYLCAKQAWMAVIVLTSVAFYVPVTVVITEQRGKLRRELNSLDNKKSAKVTDALLNYETVKYFTNEPMEERSYRAAIEAYQRSEFVLLVSLNALNFVQGAIMFGGVAAGMALAAQKVATGGLTVGDAVLFLQLMSQIYAPLNFFGSYYRTIQRQMIDMENLFDLLETHGGVRDAPGAAQLTLRGGALEFRDVWFGYKPERLVLKDLSLRIPAGSSAAFVGATGAGKSTLLRLLFRFYDPSSGSVLFDNQDLRTVTQASLRGAIGVVPQDTVLFNDTIFHNIAYGRPGASEQEVKEAAAAAMLHESIMARFPEQYHTVVGERGLRLSGGEKQRVAIARAILKNPPVLILDEATSSLDSITEREIQACLQSMKARRTTITIAHRLSTVMDADTIVVLDDGRIVESGSHSELLARRGRYSQLWQQQLSSPSVDDLATHARMHGGGGGGGGGAAATPLESQAATPRSAPDEAGSSRTEA